MERTQAKIANIKNVIVNETMGISTMISIIWSKNLKGRKA
jgi:hypothetical protein